jgi:hypothetical protein
MPLAEIAALRPTSVMVSVMAVGVVMAGGRQGWWCPSSSRPAIVLFCSFSYFLVLFFRLSGYDSGSKGQKT